MPFLLRWAGFAAAVLLVVVGWLGGALPGSDPASTPVTIARGPYGPVILGGWLVGTAVMAYAWWAARDRVPSARWALTTGVLWALPFLLVPPLGSRDVYSYACQGYLVVNGLNPYEAGVNSLPCPWIEAVSPIWRDTAAPYGPLFILLSAAILWSAGDSFLLVMAGFRLVAVAGLALVAWGLPVLARRCGVPVGRALWLALAGPLIGAHLVAGPHNDALMIGLVVAGLAVAASAPLSVSSPGTSAGPASRPLAAGALLGLAVAVKVTAIVVVPFAMLLLLSRPLSAGRSWRPAALLAVGTAAAMFVVTAASGLGVGWIGGMVNTRDLVQFTSPPTAVGMTVTYLGQLMTPGFDAVPVARAVALVLFVIALPVLWWRCHRAIGDPRAAALHGAALALTATVVLSPYFHPWYAVWPLILLAATTTRTALVTAATIAASLLVLPDGGGLARFAKFPGAPIMTVLLVVLLIRYLRRSRDRAIEPSVPTPRQIGAGV